MAMTWLLLITVRDHLDVSARASGSVHRPSRPWSASRCLRRRRPVAPAPSIIGAIFPTRRELVRQPAYDHGASHHGAVSPQAKS